MHMHIRGKSDIHYAYKGKSHIFGVRILPKAIFVGPNKTESMFMIFLDTKHRDTDISGFAGGNPDFDLLCFGIFYVHLQVPKYKMS